MEKQQIQVRIRLGDILPISFDGRDRHQTGTCSSKEPHYYIGVELEDPSATPTGNQEKIIRRKWRGYKICIQCFQEFSTDRNLNGCLIDGIVYSQNEIGKRSRSVDYREYREYTEQ